jgi:hypothetical protein
MTAAYFTADEVALLAHPRLCDFSDCAKTTALTVWLAYGVIRCDKHPPRHPTPTRERKVIDHD